MKKVSGRKGYIAAALLAFAAGAALTVPDANAQGSRRKRVPTNPPVTLPAGTIGGAQVISRAADFPDTDAILPAKSDEKKLPESPVVEHDENARMISELRARVQGLESGKKVDSDEKQKRLLLNLDILNRAEQRSESLRKQLFEMIEKESNTKTRLDLLETNLRPEAIEREVAFAGTLRPEDLRNLKKKQLEIERTNLQAVLAEIQKTRTTLDQNLQRSDAMVEKLRVKLEKEIDDALSDDVPKPF